MPLPITPERARRSAWISGALATCAGMVATSWPPPTHIKLGQRIAPGAGGQVEAGRSLVCGCLQASSSGWPRPATAAVIMESGDHQPAPYRQRL